MAHYQSMIFSVDTLATLSIYFVPKFLAEEVRLNHRNRVSGISFASEPTYRNGIIESFRDELLNNARPNSRAVSFVDPSRHSSISSSGQSSTPFTLPAEQDPHANKVRKNTSNTSLASLADSAQGNSSDLRGAEDEEIAFGVDSAEEASLMKRRIEELERKNSSLETENEYKTLRLEMLEEEVSLLKEHITLGHTDA
jgi:hypothetical protein